MVRGGSSAGQDSRQPETAGDVTGKTEGNPVVATPPELETVTGKLQRPKIKSR